MGIRVCRTRYWGLLTSAFLLLLILIGCSTLRTDNMPAGEIVVHESNMSSIPLYQQEMLSDPGWNQPHIPMEGRSSPTAPSPTSTKAIDNHSIVKITHEESGMAETIESWFIPKAYADDHKLDERYLIREGECSLKAENYKDAAGQVEGIAKLYNGMIADSHSQKLHDESVEGWLKLRIPTENFFDAWRDVREIGEVLEESVSTQDVSQQYVGYVSRLKNLMAEQAVLTEMLDEALAVQRARGLGEGYSILLDTQERLFKVTGEIESTEDRMGALADQITRSTITVRITEIKKLPEQIKETFSWGFSETAGGAFKDLQSRVSDLANGVIYFLITCWTWLIPWAIVFFIGRWAYRKYVVPQLKKETKLKQAVSTPKGDFKPKG